MHRSDRRRADALVHHPRTHRARRDHDDRGIARPSADRCVRARRRGAVRLLHAGPGRVGRSARRREPESVRRGDSTSDGGQHLPLRHVPAHRGGDPALARLIRTEKEVEGRFEEVWIVVEEDPLTQWPTGPQAVVGRDAVRKDALERVRGEARYTADVQLPGMLHAAVLRSPHAHARVKRIDFAKALAAPGVHAAVGPLTDEVGYHGEAVAAVAADTVGHAQRALRLIDVEWEELEVVLDPEEAVRRELFASDPSTYERGEFERALAEADVVVEGTYRTSVV